MKQGSLLGLVPTGTGTIALDPTFGSFTLLEPISHQVTPFFGESVQNVQIGTDSFGVQSVDTVARCTTSYLLAGPACL